MSDKKNILFLTFYFEPDLCAGSFRNSPLAYELAKQAKKRNCRVEVITTLPNRYASFETKADTLEVKDNLSINRINIPLHRSGLFDQVKSFFSYYREVKKITKNRQYDLVYASTSRLFTGWLGSQITRRLHIPLYLDVRDIFLDTIKDININKFVKLLLRVPLKFIESRTFNRANHINLISKGFDEYFQEFNCDKSYYSHGIDKPFIESNFVKKNDKNNKRTILYAGNLGEGQGLHKIIPKAAKRTSENYIFKVFGDGGTKDILLESLHNENIDSVEIKNPINRRELLYEYQKSDMLLIHLNNYQAFQKVLPSKVFELGATGKPIIAGVQGYAKQFLRNNIPDTFFFEPGNADSLIHLLNGIKESDLIIKDRSEFIARFNRNQINKEMAASILSYL